MSLLNKIDFCSGHLMVALLSGGVNNHPRINIDQDDALEHQA